MAENFARTIIVMFNCEVSGEGTENAELGATTTCWHTDDATCAANLREQLSGLLGTPDSEGILPATALSILADNTRDIWPGAVHVHGDKA